MKKVKAPMNVHTSKSQIGMGDHYGTGIKAKIGSLRESYMNPSKASMKKLGNPPRSLA